MSVFSFTQNPIARAETAIQQRAVLMNGLGSGLRYAFRIGMTVLVLVAVSFMFGPLRNVSMGARVFTAICFGLIFTILQRMLHNVSLVYEFAPFVAVLVPLLLCGGLGLLLFRKTA